ncbi:MAG: glycosyltransferase family 4 protein, partial [Candidatus Nomurabacteria bacterium]|nr:glycosyltransferase family 4 protein [Candidatus Nomurabacteria bacterium]
YAIPKDLHAHLNLLAATDELPEVISSATFGAYSASQIWNELIKKSGNESLPSDIRELQAQYMDFLVKYLADANHLPSVIHAHDWLTFEAAERAKATYDLPFVAHVHATEFDRAGGNSGNALVHEIEYNGLTAADHILTVSNATKQIITHKYDIPQEKITVVHNGWVEPAASALPIAHFENLHRRGHRIITTVARLTLQKGLTHLLQAFALAIKHNPKITLVIAGSGEEKHALIDLSHDLGIQNNVIFTGFLQGADLQSLYKISDVFVMSSISEPFGLTALEAAHQGDALIITKQSGVSEILNSVFTYDYWDINKLADILVGISLSNGLLHTLQSNIQHEYHKISWDDVANKTLQIYQTIAK